MVNIKSSLFVFFVTLTISITGCTSQPAKIQPVNGETLPPLAKNLDAEDEYEFALGVAQLAIKNKRYDRAEEILTKLRQAKPDDIRIYRLLAKLYEQKGQLDLAWIAWHKALKMDGANLSDESEFARLSLLTRHYREAEAIYKKWLDEAVTDQEKARAYNNLGLSALLQQNYRQAEQYFTKALQVDPLNKKARQNLQRVKSLHKHNV